MCLAIPGRVTEVLDGPDRLARVEVAGVSRTVSLGLLDAEPDELVGEWVLIHVGFALSRIDEVQARSTLALLAEMGERYEQELREMRDGAPA